MAIEVEIAAALLSGFIGGNVAHFVWRLVRYRAGRQFSYQDFLEGMRIGGAQEEDYQYKLNSERLNQLQMFCNEHNDQGYVPIQEMFDYIGTLWGE